MTPRTYSNIAVETTLQASIGIGTLSFTVGVLTGYPSVPFAITVDPGGALEEVMLVTGVVGTTVTVTRAYDGSTAKAHTLGAIVRHTAIADDFRGTQLGGREVLTTAPGHWEAPVWDASLSAFRPGMAGQAFYRTRADNTGASNATAQLQTDLAAAALLNHKRLYLPAGTYRLDVTSGTIFTVSADNLEIFGDGIGKTIIQIPANTILTGDLTLFLLTGRNQWLHDFSIQIGSGISGTFDIVGASAYTGSFYSKFTRLEVSGVYGNSTAGGSGITTYQLYNQAEVSTTLGTTIASGVRTVQPGSMNGIYKGRTLVIGGTTETIQVTSITELTFTATFANAHNAADAVTGASNARQYVQIEGCIVRDSYKATGFVVNSAANTLRHCQVLHVGSNSTQHGFYVQAAQNDFIGCHVEGVGGYSYHQHIATAVTDASGNRYISCESINPGTQHFVADDSTSDGTNYDVPNLESLDRYVTVTSCLFRRTKNGPACQGVLSSVPALISNCTLEDAIGAVGNTWLDPGPNGVAIGNILRVLNGGFANSLGISAQAGATIKANHFIGWATGTAAIKAFASSRLHDNELILASAGVGITLFGNDVEIVGNRISGACQLGVNVFAGAYTGLTFRNNLITATASDAQIRFQSGAIPSGVVADNTLSGTLRYDGGNTGLFIRNHVGGLSFRSSTIPSITLDDAAGHVIQFAKGTNTLTMGLLVKISSGILTTISTVDTVFFGVAVSDCDATNSSVFIAGGVGTDAKILCDGAWTAGNIGVISTTSAGKIHDSGGTTPPASPASYVVFLDSGGGAGTARCLVVKTL